MAKKMWSAGLPFTGCHWRCECGAFNKPDWTHCNACALLRPLGLDGVILSLITEVSVLRSRVDKAAVETSSLRSKQICAVNEVGLLKSNATKAEVREAALERRLAALEADAEAREVAFARLLAAVEARAAPAASEHELVVGRVMLSGSGDGAALSGSGDGAVLVDGQNDRRDAGAAVLESKPVPGDGLEPDDGIVPAVGNGTEAPHGLTTLVQKVEWIKVRLRIAAGTSVLKTVEKANELVGVVADGGLVPQVDRLLFLLSSGEDASRGVA